MDKADLRKERRRIQNRESQRRFRERHRLRQTQGAAHVENLRTRTRKVAISPDDANNLIVTQDLNEESRSFQPAKSDVHSYDVAADLWNQRHRSQRSTYSPSTSNQILDDVKVSENTFRSPLSNQPHPGTQVRLPDDEQNLGRGLGVDQRVWSSFDDAAYRSRENDIARERSYAFALPETQAYAASPSNPGAGVMFMQPNQTSFPPWTALPVSFESNINSKYATTLFVSR